MSTSGTMTTPRGYGGTQQLQLPVIYTLIILCTGTTSSEPLLHVCEECLHPESQALWWQKTGLNCRKGDAQGSCDICVTSGNQAACAVPKSASECCDLCTKWNSNALPNGAKTNGKLCHTWYWNGGGCLLKDCPSKEECDPVPGDNMVSGPGCVVPPSWGWPFVFILLGGLIIYLVGGVGYSVKVHGKELGLQSLPHQDIWLEVIGMTKDGLLFFAKTAQAKVAELQGTNAGYEPVANAQTTVAAPSVATVVPKKDGGTAEVVDSSQARVPSPPRRESSGSSSDNDSDLAE